MGIHDTQVIRKKEVKKKKNSTSKPERIRTQSGSGLSFLTQSLPNPFISTIKSLFSLALSHFHTSLLRKVIGRAREGKKKSAVSHTKVFPSLFPSFHIFYACIFRSNGSNRHLKCSCVSTNHNYFIISLFLLSLFSRSLSEVGFDFFFFLSSVGKYTDLGL